MSDTIVINGDLAGRDVVKGNSVDVSALIAAKMKAKIAEAEREAAEEAQGTAPKSGGVTITGSKITIGGRVVSGDLFTTR